MSECVSERRSITSRKKSQKQDSGLNHLYSVEHRLE